jgi:hypothetical protein
MNQATALEGQYQDMTSQLAQMRDLLDEDEEPQFEHDYEAESGSESEYASEDGEQRPISFAPVVLEALPDADDPWQPMHDPNSGKTYYVNKITLTSSWTHPSGDSSGHGAASEQSHASSGGCTDQRRASSSADSARGRGDPGYQAEDAFQPTINQRSRELAEEMGREGNFVGRMEKDERERKRALDQKRHEALVADSQRSFAPQINAHSRALAKELDGSDDIVEKSRKQVLETERKNQQLRERLAAREMEQVQDKPQINARSAKMAEGRNFDDAVQVSGSRPCPVAPPLGPPARPSSPLTTTPSPLLTAPSPPLTAHCRTGTNGAS